jgi:glycosyltransferase involved in cell wall biosynthesis
MDYNIRAARAGFRGLWAQSAFVWRGQPPLRRQYSEALLFDSNKRRYQDKFCGRRLRGEHFPYEQHCRGDACEHFAPSRLVNISGCATAASPPMVTCLMPTRGRREEVLQSVRYFQRQTWPERELIILDDADGEDLSTLLPTDPAVRYFRLPAGQSIGAKRNRGCELARGGIVAQWDDDDWYGPRRLEVQVRPIVTGQADMTGLAAFFFDLPAWTFWTCTPKLHARIFYGDVHGGTLTFRRELWERGARYPDASLAEDAAFLQRVLLSGGRLLRIENDGHFLYIRHGDNSWKLECGRYGEASGWRRMAEPEFWRADRNFYSARSSAITAEARQPTSLDPLVTCVMPTAGRREFAARAISYFQRQNYVRLHTRSTLGSKRNMAASLARGEIIAHWDDDDWIAEWRLAYQVQALLRQADDAVCGLNRLLHLQHGARSAWLYTYPPQERGWLAGGTLCYRKTLLQRHPFPDVNDGEDTRFVWTLPASSLVAHPDHTFYVATVHAHNTSRKNTSDGRWQSREVNEIQRLMQDDFEFYRSGH